MRDLCRISGVMLHSDEFGYHFRGEDGVPLLLELDELGPRMADERLYARVTVEGRMVGEHMIEVVWMGGLDVG